MTFSLPLSIRQLTSDLAINRIHPVEPGMSGAAVFRCFDDHNQSFALKRWPKQTSPKRVREIHRVQTVARQNGCDLVPKLITFGNEHTVTLAGGYLWELAQWIPGIALASDAAPEQIALGAAAIGRFHHCVRELGTECVPVPPALIRRANRVRELGELLPQIVRDGHLEHHSPLVAAALGRAVTLLSNHWPIARRRLQDLQENWVGSLCQMVLRDIHREHLLMLQDTPAGIIDFDAIRADTFITDLARWVGSFLVGRSDCDSIWNAVAVEYFQTCPSCGCDQDAIVLLAKKLHSTTVWISLANWAVWLGLECRNFDARPEILADRIHDWCELAIADMGA